MKVPGNIARWLFIFSLPPLIMSAVINVEFNSMWLYEDGFAKYGVSESTGLDEAELEKVARGLIDYFNSSDEYIALTVNRNGEKVSLFSEREIIHLRDVKALVGMNRHLLMGTAVYTGIYAGFCLFWRRGRYRRKLASSVVIGSLVTLGTIIALGAGSMLFDFNSLFTRFHLIAFTNEFWMLDPREDYLIMLFPEGFWYDAALMLGGISAAIAGALCGSGVIYLKRSGKNSDESGGMS
ncbi:MAG: TIGR01906 family membrane protein [Dehalococcoidales bacterium]